MQTELNSIITQVISSCEAEKIILFGSRSREHYRENSDFDLCIICPSNNKRRTLANLYCNVDSNYPIDFLLYTPTEWRQAVKDVCSFAYAINQEGVVLYGRQCEI
ncbi:nucleotidyltransferase domain-containing protein [Aminipila butyrica]